MPTPAPSALTLGDQPSASAGGPPRLPPGSTWGEPATELLGRLTAAEVQQLWHSARTWCYRAAAQVTATDEEAFGPLDAPEPRHVQPRHVKPTPLRFV